MKQKGYKRPLLLIVAFLVILALAVGGVMSVLAVWDLGIFELDRNAVDGAVAGDDWDTLYGGGGSAALLGYTFVEDGDSPDDIT